MPATTTESFTTQYAEKYARWQSLVDQYRDNWEQNDADPLYARIAGYAAIVSGWDRSFRQEYLENRTAFSGVRAINRYSQWRAEKVRTIRGDTQAWVAGIAAHAAVIEPHRHLEAALLEEHGDLYHQLYPQYSYDRLFGLPTTLQRWTKRLTEGFTLWTDRVRLDYLYWMPHLPGGQAVRMPPPIWSLRDTSPVAPLSGAPAAARLAHLYPSAPQEILDTRSAEDDEPEHSATTVAHWKREWRQHDGRLVHAVKGELRQIAARLSAKLTPWQAKARASFRAIQARPRRYAAWSEAHAADLASLLQLYRMSFEKTIQHFPRRRLALYRQLAAKLPDDQKDDLQDIEAAIRPDSTARMLLDDEDGGLKGFDAWANYLKFLLHTWSLTFATRRTREALTDIFDRRALLPFARFSTLERSSRDLETVSDPPETIKAHIDRAESSLQRWRQARQFFLKQQHDYHSLIPTELARPVDALFSVFSLATGILDKLSDRSMLYDAETADPASHDLEVSGQHKRRHTVLESEIDNWADKLHGLDYEGPRAKIEQVLHARHGLKLNGKTTGETIAHLAEYFAQVPDLCAMIRPIFTAVPGLQVGLPAIEAVGQSAGLLSYGLNPYRFDDLLREKKAQAAEGRRTIGIPVLHAMKKAGSLLTGRPFSSADATERDELEEEQQEAYRILQQQIGAEHTALRRQWNPPIFRNFHALHGVLDDWDNEFETRPESTLTSRDIGEYGQRYTGMLSGIGDRYYAAKGQGLDQWGGWLRNTEHDFGGWGKQWEGRWQRLAAKHAPEHLTPGSFSSEHPYVMNFRRWFTGHKGDDFGRYAHAVGARAFGARLDRTYRMTATQSPLWNLATSSPAQNNGGSLMETQTRWRSLLETTLRLPSPSGGELLSADSDFAEPHSLPRTRPPRPRTPWHKPAGAPPTPATGSAPARPKKPTAATQSQTLVFMLGGNRMAGGVLDVAHLERIYEQDGAEELAESDRERLDRISLLARDRAEQMLRNSPGAVLDDVEVDVDLDLSMSNLELAQVWGEAIAQTVRARLPASQTTPRFPQPVQHAGGADATDDEIRRSAQEGIQTPGSEMPFKNRLQRAFGPVDLGQIRAHVGNEAASTAASMGARAYASGEDIVFAGTPDLRTAAHEAAHIIQQRFGLQPDSGIGQPGDLYEQQAETIASRVVAGESAVDLLPAPGDNTPSVSSRAIQRDPPSAGQPATAITIRFGPYAPTTNSALANILRTLSNEMRDGLIDVEAGAPIRADITQWMSHIESWITFLLPLGQDPITNPMVQGVVPFYDDLLVLRRRLEEYKAQRIRQNLEAAQATLASLSAQIQNTREDLQNAMRAAFLRQDESLISRISNMIGNVLDIGLGINELSRDIASSINSLRGATVTLPVSRVTAWFDRLNRILSAANLVMSIAGMDAPTEVGRATNQINVATGVFSAGTTLLSMSAHIGLYANLYLVPMVQAITTRLNALLDRHLHELATVSAAIGEVGPTDVANEPGGWPTFQFMFRVMRAGGPEGVPWPVDSQVEGFFLNWREQINAGTREMPTEGHWFWRSLDESQFRGWVFTNRRMLWSMFYGNMPVPQRLTEPRRGVQRITKDDVIIRPPDPGTSGHPEIKRGDNNPLAVKEAQNKLRKANLPTSSHLSVDGIFGPRTEQATKDFQTHQTLPPTGIINHATWQKLDNMGASNVGVVERNWHETASGISYAMTSKYSWQIDYQKILIKAGINFVHPTDPTKDPPDFETKANDAVTSMQNRWNAFKAVYKNPPPGGIFTPAGRRIPPRRNIQFEISRGEGMRVELINTPGRSDGGHFFTLDPNYDNTVTHEFGHMIGLADEYQQEEADYKRSHLGADLPAGPAAPVGFNANTVATNLHSILTGTGPDGTVTDTNRGQAADNFVTTSGLVQGAKATGQLVRKEYETNVVKGGNLINDLNATFRSTHVQDDPTGAHQWRVMDPFQYTDTTSLMGSNIFVSPEPRHVNEFVMYIQQYDGGEWQGQRR